MCPFIDVSQKYLSLASSLEICESLPVNDIKNESTLQCPPPPSETNSLSESTGLPETPTSSKGDIAKEDHCDDGM